MLEKGDEEMEMPDLGEEDQSELDKSVVEKIMKEKEKKQALKPCGHMKKSKENKRGLVLVDRPRRSQNTGETTMEKDMHIKQKKNLEVVKGNSFSDFQTDYLNQVAQDAHIRIGCDNDDNSRLIDSLKNEESLKHINFVDENPDMLLPANLDVELEMQEGFKPNVSEDIENNHTPTGSIKEPDTSVLWTEVVMKGRNRNKIKGVNEKIHPNDRCCLEYYRS
jgi:hypothetical protein